MLIKKIQLKLNKLFCKNYMKKIGIVGWKVGDNKGNGSKSRDSSKNRPTERDPPSRHPQDW